MDSINKLRTENEALRTQLVALREENKTLRSPSLGDDSFWIDAMREAAKLEELDAMFYRQGA